MNTPDLLKPLRGMYLAQLRERTVSVSGFLKRCRGGEPPESERELMRHLAHKLAGSGTTYGFPLITQAARTLEEALQPEAPPAGAEALARLSESLLRVCEQALLSVERGSQDPALRSPEAIAGAPTTATEGEPVEPRIGAGKTVLIADDDPAIRELLAYKFRQRGARVLTAGDGAEALQRAREERPDLAILDRMMPALDGVQVLLALRESPETKGIPVIFLTAMRQEKDILEGFRLGVADYVLKPFLPEEVLARSFRLWAPSP